MNVGKTNGRLSLERVEQSLDRPELVQTLLAGVAIPHGQNGIVVRQCIVQVLPCQEVDAPTLHRQNTLLLFDHGVCSAQLRQEQRQQG